MYQYQQNRCRIVVDITQRISFIEFGTVPERRRSTATAWSAMRAALVLGIIRCVFRSKLILQHFTVCYVEGGGGGGSLHSVLYAFTNVDNFERHVNHAI